MERFCQSCCMPLQDHQGINRDGTLSLQYCDYCWKNGEFTQPEITTGKEMQSFVYNCLCQKYKYSPFKAWFSVLLIPKLKRWENTKK